MIHFAHLPNTSTTRNYHWFYITLTLFLGVLDLALSSLSNGRSWVRNGKLASWQQCRAAGVTAAANEGSCRCSRSGKSCWNEPRHVYVPWPQPRVYIKPRGELPVTTHSIVEATWVKLYADIVLIADHLIIRPSKVTRLLQSPFNYRTNYYTKSKMVQEEVYSNNFVSDFSESRLVNTSLMFSYPFQLFITPKDWSE